MTVTFDWSAVAPAWDAHRRHTHTTTSPVTEALVAALGLVPGEAVLELATGTGELALRLAGLVGATGSVLATDAAAGMVALTQAILEGLPQARTAQVDAAATGLGDGVFDAVVCCHGLMFVPEPSKALSECHRVLRAGGRLAAAVWAAPQHNPWVSNIGMAAMVHGLAAGGPPTGPGGLFSLADPDALRTLVEGAGFRDVHLDEVAVSFTFASSDEYFEIVSSLAGPLAALIAAGPPEQRAAVQATATELVASHRRPDGKVELPGLALVVSGRA